MVCEICEYEIRRKYPVHIKGTTINSPAFKGIAKIVLERHFKETLFTFGDFIKELERSGINWFSRRHIKRLWQNGILYRYKYSGGCRYYYSYGRYIKKERSHKQILFSHEREKLIKEMVAELKKYDRLRYKTVVKVAENVVSKNGFNKYIKPSTVAKIFFYGKNGKDRTAKPLLEEFGWIKVEGYPTIYVRNIQIYLELTGTKGETDMVGSEVDSEAEEVAKEFKEIIVR